MIGCSVYRKSIASKKNKPKKQMLVDIHIYRDEKRTETRLGIILFSPIPVFPLMLYIHMYL